jgi:hypothetical protein
MIKPTLGVVPATVTPPLFRQRLSDVPLKTIGCPKSVALKTTRSVRTEGAWIDDGIELTKIPFHTVPTALPRVGFDPDLYDFITAVAAELLESKGTIVSVVVVPPLFADERLIKKNRLPFAAWPIAIAQHKFELLLFGAW